MSKHWIVVADGGGAKVYESDALLQDLTLLDGMHGSGSHISHDDGRSHAPVPGAGRGAHEARHDQRRELEERLARAVAQSLDEAHHAHRYDRLVLAAPARFLGDLRAALSDGARHKVVASFDHDWTRLSPRDLSAAILNGLPPDAGKGLD